MTLQPETLDSGLAVDEQTTERVSPEAYLLVEPGRSASVLITIPIFITLFTYFGSNAFYESNLAGAEGYRSIDGYVYHHLGALVILGFGALCWGSLLGLPPRRLGAGAGDARYGFTVCAWSIPLLVIPGTWFGAQTASVMSEYPLAKEALEGPVPFALHAFFYLAYYIGWESFFRGYCLFSLREKFGDWGAILIQTIPSVLIHTSIVATGKPFSETMGAIPLGIALGVLALRTGSFWYGFIIHAAIGISIDGWIYAAQLATP